jgi:methylaspartate mutase epsilon subunit
VLEERAAYEKRPVCFDMVEDDIFAVGRGVLIGRPEK